MSLGKARCLRPLQAVAVKNDPATGYGWREVHADLEEGLYAGNYGWDHAAYWGIAEAKAGVDLKEWYKTRTEAEFYLPEFKELADHPETQRHWESMGSNTWSLECNIRGNVLQVEIDTNLHVYGVSIKVHIASREHLLSLHVLRRLGSDRHLRPCGHDGAPSHHRRLQGEARYP